MIVHLLLQTVCSHRGWSEEKVFTVTPTYSYMQSPMTCACDPDSKIPSETPKKRKLHRLFHHLHVSTQTYIRVSWVSLPSLIYSMTSSMIDWPSVVTEKKTVSSDCLFRGNQAVINFALLTLSELLRQVNRPSQVLMKAGFWSGVNGADHCIHSGLFTPSEIKPAWQTVTWKQPLNFMFLYAWWLPSNQAFRKALFLWFWL